MGQLGLSADQFWGLTMREFWATYYGKLGRKQTTRPMDGKRLKELMEKFPDGNDARRTSR